MAFRNRVTSLSQLAADVITGAIFQTSDPPNARLKISEESPFGSPEGVIRFYDTNDTDAQSSKILFNNSTLALYGPNAHAASGTDPAELFISGDTFPGGNQPLFDFYHGLIRAEDGIRIGFNNAGRKIGALDWGHTSKSVSGGDGHITVSHSLLNIPDLVVWSDDAGNHPFIARLQTSSYDVNGFTVLARNSTTDALAPNGTTIGGSWIAISLAS